VQGRSYFVARVRQVERDAAVAVVAVAVVVAAVVVVVVVVLAAEVVAAVGVDVDTAWQQALAPKAECRRVADMQSYRAELQSRRLVAYWHRSIEPVRDKERRERHSW